MQNKYNKEIYLLLHFIVFSRTRDMNDLNDEINNRKYENSEIYYSFIWEFL